MSGLGALALGAAPLAGGLLAGGMLGKRKPNVPDLRGVIKTKLELLERIPEDQVTLRAGLKQTIEAHVAELIMATKKHEELRRKTRYFRDKGNWRDLVLVLTAVLFVVVAWEVDHRRPLWLEMFIAVIVMAVVTAVVALRGFLRSVRADDDHDQQDIP